MKKTSMKNILSGKPAKAKAPAKKTTKKPAMPMMEPTHEPKTVRITKAQNGLTVSTYGREGEQIKVAKSTAEAMRHCKEMLG